MQSTQIYKDFDLLNSENKNSYVKGFKLAYNLCMLKRKNKNVNDLISTLLNYKTDSIENTNNIEEKQNTKQNINQNENIENIEKNNNLLKNKNKELLEKIETIIKICPQNKKSSLVNSLKESLFFDKKYTESLNLLKNLKSNIKENKDNNIWINQMKYIKVVNYYKQKLQLSHDKLHNNISNINNIKNIKPNINKKIIKTISFNSKNDIADLENEKVEDSVLEQVEDSVQEHLEENHQERVQEQLENPVQEQVEEPVQEQVEEPVQEQVEESVQEQVEDSVQEPVQEEVEDSVQEQVEDSVQEQVEDSVQDLFKKK